MAYRVVQWSTGADDDVVARAVIDHPDLDLIGVLTGGAEDPTAPNDYQTPAIPATHDLDTLLALIPDCILISGTPPPGEALPKLVRILTSGANVVALSTVVPEDPHDRDLFLAWAQAAAEKGASSFLAAGEATTSAAALTDVIVAVCRARPGVLAVAEVQPHELPAADGPGGE